MPRYEVFDWSTGQPNLRAIDTSASAITLAGDTTGPGSATVTSKAHGLAFFGALPGGEALGTLLYDVAIVDAAKWTLDPARLALFVDASAASQISVLRSGQFYFAYAPGATSGNFVFIKDDLSIAYGELDWGIDGGIQWSLLAANQWRVKLDAVFGVQVVEPSTGVVVGLAVGAAAIDATKMGANTGNNVVYIGTAITAPTANPVGGFILYVDPADGILKARGPGGTVTPLALP